MFSIRVELHYASREDYVTLAESLGRVGIVDTVVGDNGVRYKLPPAEYSYVGNATLNQVFEAARTAANSTGRTYAVVANEVLRRTWIGLAVA
jgi:hypothetical protein